MFLFVYFRLITHVSIFILVYLLFFNDHGTIHQSSCACTQQNGVAELKMSHLLEVIYAISFYKHVPKSH